MASQRLLQVNLPASTFDAIDRALERHGDAYRGDRSVFIRDAIENFLAVLETEERKERVRPTPAPFTADQAAARLTLRAPGSDIRTCAGAPRATGPEARTLGIHNRDWPTLWAASELGRIPEDESDRFAGKDTGTAAAGQPATFSDWRGNLEQYAWNLTLSSTNSRAGLSGLPSPFSRSAVASGTADDQTSGLDRKAMTKRKKDATSRFRTHYVGTSAGHGPLFSLHLAGVDPEEPSRIMLTPEGAHLLRALDGLAPIPSETARPEHRRAFLAHLARWVPADFEFLAGIVRQIAAGNTQRQDLLRTFMKLDGETGEDPSTVLTANLAGFISRGREWGLIDPKQNTGRIYLLMPNALEAVETAERDAAA